MKKKLLFFLLLLPGLLTACQQAPEEVVNRMESYGESIQLKEEEIQYCSIGELREASIEDIEEEPQNLILPDQVDFSDVEAVELVTFQRSENYMEQRDIVAALFGISNPDWEIVEAEGLWSEAVSDENHYYLAVDDNGEISYLGGAEYDNLSDDNWPATFRRFYLNRGQAANMECVLQGETVSLQEQLSWAQSWIDNCGILNDEFDYKLRTVYVKENTEGNQRIALLFQKMYKGIGLDYLEERSETVDGTVVMTQASAEVSMEIDRAGEPSCFYNKVSAQVQSSESVDEVIDFASAVKLAEKKLAGFSKLKVEEIRLQYTLHPEYDYENGESYDTQGVLLRTRPVYSFWINREDEEVEGTDIGTTEVNELVFVNVDMLDGTVTTNFEEHSFHGTSSGGDALEE